MAYIGNTVQNQGFAPAIDYFSGNGVTVTFTLSRPIASVAQIICAIDNVIQNPGSAFTVSGNSITFTSAPLSGTNNIWVEYTSLITTYAAISQDPSVIGDITASGGYLSTGDFGNSYIDGIVVDYVTGNARLTTGPVDGLTIYNGGTAGRNALMTLSAAGNMGIGTTSPATPIDAIGEIRSMLQASGDKTGISLTNNGTTNGRVQFSTSDGTPRYYIQANGNTSLDFVTVLAGTPTTAMSINRTSNYITMPYQPAFAAYKTSTSTIAANTQIDFGTVLINISSSYNSGTSTFTAPVAGTYCILAKVQYVGAGAGIYIGAQLMKNGVVYTQSYGSTYTNTAHISVAIDTLVTLAAGDTLIVKTAAFATSAPETQGDTDKRTMFCGYLVG